MGFKGHPAAPVPTDKETFPMRMLGPVCAVAIAMSCSPAMAYCPTYRIIIGKQIGGNADGESTVQYDLRANTFSLTGAENRKGPLTSLCDQNVVILYEQCPVEQGRGLNQKCDLPAVLGVCWVTVSGSDASGICLRDNQKAATLKGTIY
jgi:hypothetical protein